MQQSFKRTVGSLDEIFVFVARFVDTHDLDESVSFSLNLAVEEIFTNMVKYNTGGGEDIAIAMGEANGSVIVEMIDHDVDPFEPGANEEVRVDDPLEKRTPGGLGLHLVTSVVDKLAYEYENREMKVTIIKNLE